MNIFVGNLEYRVSEDELKEAFSSHGNVESVRIITNRHTGKSKGFAFVVMPDDKEAQAAMDALNGQEINGRPVIVNEARRTEEERDGFEDEERPSERPEPPRERERERLRRDRY